MNDVGHEPSPQPLPMHVARIYALLIAALYVFVVGFGGEPAGLQTTVLTGLFLTALVHLLRIERNVSTKEIVLFSLGLVNSAYFAITTNAYLVELHWLVFFIIGTLFVVSLACDTRFPIACGELLSRSWRTGILAVLCFFESARMRAFFRAPGGRRIPKPKRVTVVGAMLSVPLLTFFHVLFANTNEEYAVFMSETFRKIIELLELILQIEFIVDCFWTAGLAYALFVLFSLPRPTSPVGERARSLSESVGLMVGAAIALFLVFFRFQTKLLFIPPASLSFQELSRYVQRGFWELLIIALTGYGVVLFSLFHRPLELETTPRWRRMLCAFAAELLLITVFALHKLGVLQTYFGLKDQRVLATVATLLIAMTFVLLVLQMLGRLSREQLFERQIFALVGSVVLLSALNLDDTITRVRPTSYQLDGVRYMDYSYLLTNSYDNAGRWLAIFDEAERTGIRFPEGYYWGRYSSLCGRNSNGGQQLQSHWTRLARETNPRPDESSFTTLSRFNYHRFLARRLMDENATRFSRFEAFVKEQCERGGATR